MYYFKIKSIIFEIELFEDPKFINYSNINDNDNKNINPEYALYSTNKFKILKYKHIADNNITEQEFNMCIIYLHIQQIKEDLIDDKVLNIIKNKYDIYKMEDFINKEINRQIYYFKSYERAFNFRFIYDKQYELFEKGYSGIYKNWTNKGVLVLEFYHINGRIEGSSKRGDSIHMYVNDKPIDGGISSVDLINIDHYYFDHE